MDNLLVPARELGKLLARCRVHPWTKNATFETVRKGRPPGTAKQAAIAVFFDDGVLSLVFRKTAAIRVMAV